MPNFPLQLTRSNSQAKVRVRVPDALLLSCSFSSFISVDFIVIYGAATRSDKFSEALGWNGAVGISFLLTLSRTIVEGIECAGHVTERLNNSV